MQSPLSFFLHHKSLTKDFQNVTQERVRIHHVIFPLFDKPVSPICMNTRHVYSSTASPPSYIFFLASQLVILRGFVCICRVSTDGRFHLILFFFGKTGVKDRFDKKKRGGSLDCL